MDDSVQDHVNVFYNSPEYFVVLKVKNTTHVDVSTVPYIYCAAL